MSTKWRKHACFCAYSLNIYMKAQKHECFRVFSPFSAHHYPPHYNITDKGLLPVMGVYGICLSVELSKGEKPTPEEIELKLVQSKSDIECPPPLPSSLDR